MSDEGEEEAKYQEHSAHSQSVSKEMHDEEEVEEESTWEIGDQPRVSTPKKSDKQEKNTEEVFQAENMEIGQGEGTIFEEKRLGPRKEIVVPSKKTNEIKELWKEQQRLINVIKQLIKQIRVLKLGKSSKRALGSKHQTTQVKPHKKKTKRTQTETIIIQDCKEQHAIVTNVEAQTESIPVCNKDVQTEAFPSSITIDQTVHEKESQL